MLRPLQDKIILKIKNDEEVTHSGIILSSNSKLKSQVATVISVGAGIMNNGVRTIMEVKENDNVFIEKGVGVEIEHDGVNYVVVAQSDILAIIG